MFAYKTFEEIQGAGSPGKYLVNIISQLKHLPEWMPGGSFKKEAKGIAQRVDRLLNEPYEASVRAIVRYSF
jgi:hypothetical protein